MKYGKGIKCILLSLRAGVGSYFHSPLAWLVLTMIVRKQKLLWNCYEGLRKIQHWQLCTKIFLKKFLLGGWISFVCVKWLMIKSIRNKFFLKFFSVPFSFIVIYFELICPLVFKLENYNAIRKLLGSFVYFINCEKTNLKQYKVAERIKKAEFIRKI